MPEHVVSTDFVLTSPAFADGQAMPRMHTGQGVDVSPPLAWQGVPQGTRQLALVCDDPDAPSAEPWVHWVAYDLSPALAGLPQGLARQRVLQHPVAARQGVNSWTSDNIGYRGPMPPVDHGVHHYHFRLYALDAELNLPPGLDKARLLAAIEPHVISTTVLIGTYKR